MTNETKEIRVQEAQKQEVTPTSEVERTRDRKAYVPRADIYETDEEIVILADMPGVDENSVDITLEKNVLAINGYVEPDYPENYSLSFAEYELGDYQRSFTLSNYIDQNNIQAAVKNGVLELRLSKTGPAKAKKIAVRAA
ncbi:MAG: Hsp20/alpha crystallin family protein [Chloroflexota bacterium]